jgi:hypothetical protein
MQRRMFTNAIPGVSRDLWRGVREDGAVFFFLELKAAAGVLKTLE